MNCCLSAELAHPVTDSARRMLARRPATTCPSLGRQISAVRFALGSGVDDATSRVPPVEEHHRALLVNSGAIRGNVTFAAIDVGHQADEERVRPEVGNNFGFRHKRIHLIGEIAAEGAVVFEPFARVVAHAVIVETDESPNGKFTRVEWCLVVSHSTRGHENATCREQVCEALYVRADLLTLTRVEKLVQTIEDEQCPSVAKQVFQSARRRLRELVSRVQQPLNVLKDGMPVAFALHAVIAQHDTQRRHRSTQAEREVDVRFGEVGGQLRGEGRLPPPGSPSTTAR